MPSPKEIARNLDLAAIQKYGRMALSLKKGAKAIAPNLLKAAAVVTPIVMAIKEQARRRR